MRSDLAGACSDLGRASSDLGSPDPGVGARAGATPVPLWFEGGVPPELRFNLQLLKAALCTRPRAATSSGNLELRGDGVPLDVTPCSAPSLLVRDDPLLGYSISALVADAILRLTEEVEGEQVRAPGAAARTQPTMRTPVVMPCRDRSRSPTGALLVPYWYFTGALPQVRRFAIVSSHAPDSEPELVLTLLCPYVTLATNRDGWGSGAGSRPTDPRPQSDANRVLDSTCSNPLPAGRDGDSAAAWGAGERGTRWAPASHVFDALKVMYAQRPSGLQAATGGAADTMHRLVLPEADERAHVLADLRASSQMLPEACRTVGHQSVGYLPVSATWE